MNNKVLITRSDSLRLRKILDELPESVGVTHANVDELARRLDGATVVAARDVPRSVVTMNSLVGLRELETNEKFSCRLAYPGEADPLKHKVSVTVPLGTGLLGARVGDTLDCETSAGARRYRLERVYYQPEAARDFHL